MANPVPAGAPFVLLNGAVVGAGLAPTDIGRELSWRYGPAGRDAADPAYAAKEHAFSGAGLKPLSPVHLRAARVSGAIVISWIRRTRTGGDAWAQVDVPLGEEREAYEVDVLGPGGAVVRTLTSTEPAVTYSNSEAMADFGRLPASFIVRVSQLSATAGRGTPREETIYV